MDMEKCIEIQNLQKSFGAIHAVNNLSLLIFFHRRGTWTERFPHLLHRSLAHMWIIWICAETKKTVRPHKERTAKYTHDTQI